MQLAIMSFIGSFMPQQVSISTSLEILLVAFSAFFSNGKGYSAIRILFLDSANRMIYFRDKRTREKISLVEVCSGI